MAEDCIQLPKAIAWCRQLRMMCPSLKRGLRKRRNGYRSPVVSTIYTVAKRAGVSTATVSRVMSQPEIVSPTTRHKVLQAVEDLGYTPNSAARHLRTLRSGKLLVTVPDICNPFFALILQGIEDAAHREGYAVLLGDTQHDETREERYALMLRRKEADGLIFLGHRLPDAAQAFIRSVAPRCAPVVNSCEFSSRLGVPGVHIDNARAAADGLEHLYRLGHQRIGIVTGPLISPLSRDRLRGVKTRAKLAGAEGDLEIVPGTFSIESGTEAADRLLSHPTPPTAIFCFNDEMAIGVLDAARQRGVRVPRDLSVVGFDDIRFARYVDPPLTTIAQPMREIGEGSVRLLLDILQGRTTTPQSITLPHTLMIRSTTAPLGSAADAAS
jgi:LacI family repressor for deo operon, udp, cdd, tsx, nupC, and nupG